MKEEEEEEGGDGGAGFSALSLYIKEFRITKMREIEREEEPLGIISWKSKFVERGRGE